MFHRFAVTVLLSCLAASPALADDGFIKGYAAAVLERELRVDGGALDVENGVITVHVDNAGRADRERIQRVLSEIDGVSLVNVVGASTHAPAEESEGEDAAAVKVAPAPAPDADSYQIDARRGLHWLPRGDLFDPLLADPRYPHMQTSIQKIDNHENAHDTITTAIGGTFGVVGGDTPNGGRWQFDLQPAVFAQFDMDNDQQDIINADYIIAGALTYAKNDWQAMLRMGHMSSHIGDEFLANNPTFTRVNFAFEWVDLIVSRHFRDKTLRLYGGAKVRYNTDPNNLDPWSIQYGVEWESAKTYWSNRLRPIAAVDMQHYEHHDWEASVSARAGVQIEDPLWAGHRLQLMLEYYNGANPSGQFFLNDRVHYWGIGAHFYY